MDSAPTGMRTVGIYVLLSFILLGTIAGGLSLSKQRQAHYIAKGDNSSTAAPKTQKPPEAHQPTPKPAESNGATSRAPSPSQNVDVPSPSSTAPVASAGASSPVSGSGQTSRPLANSGSGVQLPATGPSAVELLAADTLIVIAVYLVACTIRTNLGLKKHSA